ncbi:MAG: hypothetical protein M1584_05580 [Deltaproteobacteria bacterium]|nr:hypothetical protein [Deltaproteobacteria bacterium]
MENEPLEKFKQEFLDLAFNEKFQYLREMEQVLGEVFRGLINNKENNAAVLPVFKDLNGVNLRRAGYVLDFTRRLSDYKDSDVYRVLDEAKERVDNMAEGNGLPFFHKDKPLPPEFLFDDLAKYWGLSRGVPVQRLLQMLKPPYVC